jgi:hypothetical protein
VLAYFTVLSPTNNTPKTIKLFAVSAATQTWALAAVTNMVQSNAQHKTQAQCMLLLLQSRSFVACTPANPEAKKPV